MPNPRTTTSYALLGLLSIRSWTTYELTQQAHKSLRWFWPRAERKLYDEPKRLVEDGLATATSESTGRRPRTVYRVTPRGRRALRSWLDETPEPRSEEFAAMVKVFFAEAGSRDQLLTTIDRVEEEAAARLRELARMASTRPLVFPARGHLNALVMRMHADQEQAVLRWARWARAQVERWPSTTDTGDWDHDAALMEIAELAGRRPRTA